MRTTSAPGVDQSNDAMREASRRRQERGRRRDRPGDEICLRPLQQKMRSLAKVEKGDEERDHGHHHARHQQRQYQSVPGVHSDMSIAVAAYRMA